MKIVPCTVDAVDLPLPGGRVLRLALYRTDDGKPDALVLAAGWAEGRAWREQRGEGITLPAEALPQLRQALALLDDPHPSNPPHLKAA